MATYVIKIYINLLKAKLPSNMKGLCNSSCCLKPALMLIRIFMVSTLCISSCPLVTILRKTWLVPTHFFFSFTGGHHQAKAGQGPQEDPGAQGQVSRRWKGEGQIQGGDHWEDAGVKMIFSINKLYKWTTLCLCRVLIVESRWFRLCMLQLFWRCYQTCIPFLFDLVINHWWLYCTSTVIAENWVIVSGLYRLKNPHNSALF